MSPIELPSRIPPHNLDAERAVLGAVLLEGREALPRVVEVLRPSDFYTEAHRSIYQSMLTLFDHGEPVDPSRCKRICAAPTSSRWSAAPPRWRC